MLKSPGFVPYGDNLAQFEVKFDTPKGNTAATRVSE